MASLSEISKKINREYKNEKLIIKSNIVPHYERLKTSALGMDYPLYGGLPLGRICVYSGLAHSGKTTAACCELASFQRQFPEKTCVYVDVEHSLDLQFQSIMNGIDLEKLYYISPPAGMSGEQICDLVVELQKADDIGLIVLDSLPALIPAAVLESDLTEDKGMRGTIAKKLYPFLAEMTSLLQERNNILILINQVRDDGKTFTGVQKWKEPCGNAAGFYSSVSVRFGTRKFTLGDDMDACGSKNGEGADGFRLQFKVMKNKTASCSRGGGFLTYRFNSGLDWLNDLLEVALAFDFIHRVNNVTYELVNVLTGEIYKDKDGNLLRGKKSDLLDYIKTNIDFQNEYLAMLNKVISNEEKSYGQLLDERASAEIDKQEEDVSFED